MGLSCGAVEIIVQEHLYRSLGGLSVLLIGRQNTDITPQTMTNLLKLYDLSPRVFHRTGRSLIHLSSALPPDAAKIVDVRLPEPWRSGLKVLEALLEVQKTKSPDPA